MPSPYVDRVTGQEKSAVVDPQGVVVVTQSGVTTVSGVEENANSYYNITTQGTYPLIPSPGFLDSVIINTPVANGVVTVYDNPSAASGKKVATITLPATLISDGPIPVPYKAILQSGLTVVLSGANMDITVTGR